MLDAAACAIAFGALPGRSDDRAEAVAVETWAFFLSAAVEEKGWRKLPNLAGLTGGLTAILPDKARA